MVKQIDCRGVVIKPGVHVAYNQSGNIMPGVVQKITGRSIPVTWAPGVAWRGTFFIKNDLDGKVSKVKRVESIMAISDKTWPL